MGMWDDLKGMFIAPQRSDVANAVIAEPQQTAIVKKPEINTPKYSVKESKSGRAVLKSTSGGTPYDPVSGVADTRMSDEYKYDTAKASSPSYQHAPSMEQAFGMKPYGSGWKGALMEGGKNFLMTAIPTIIGGLVGGRKGAMGAYETALQNQMSSQAKRQAQLEDVSSNPKLRTAYELARADYENDYNNGTPQGDFGYYLGEKLLGMEDKWGSGQLGTLIKLMGPEGGLAKYEEMRQKKSGGGGGGGGTATVVENIIDPTTGIMRKITRKIPAGEAGSMVSSGVPSNKVITKVGGSTTTSNVPARSATDFFRK